MKKKGKLVGTLLVLLIAAICYYIYLPAINIHSVDVWYFMFAVVALVGIVYVFMRKIPVDEIRTSKFVKCVTVIFFGMILIFLAGSLLSSPIINAKKYQQLLTVEEDEFTKDIQEVSFDQIPLLDKETAELLGLLRSAEI